MSTSSWRGTALFTVILVVMGATVGLKLYGIGEQVTASPAAAATTTTSGSSSASGSSSGSSSGSAGSDSTTGGSASGSSSTPTPSPTQSQSSATKVVTGDAVDTRYGAVQVRVTFSGTTITAIDTIQAPDGNGRDVEINDQALPILQQEALAGG